MNQSTNSGEAHPHHGGPAAAPRAGAYPSLGRGSQYAAGDYRKILQAAAITQSMSRKANCWDNAPMESFFGTLKTELVQRIHAALGYITPEQADRKSA